MTSMSLIGHVLPPHLSTSKITNFTPQNVTPKPILFTNLISLALTVTLNSPLPSLAIPSLNSQPPLLSPTTPFSQSKNLQIGLENGKIRPCPSTNPGCVSTNPQSSSFAFPWSIPENDTGNAIQVLKLNICLLIFHYAKLSLIWLYNLLLQKLEEAILKTQKNAKIQVIEDTPNGI
ncbi:hypothetical protein OIU78_030100 [Salix suchowensis]|nr:hypothetical protein OIU78_030100 [Salix suchowensis]